MSAIPIESIFWPMESWKEFADKFSIFVQSLRKQLWLHKWNLFLFALNIKEHSATGSYIKKIVSLVRSSDHNELQLINTDCDILFILRCIEATKSSFFFLFPIQWQTNELNFSIICAAVYIYLVALLKWPYKSVAMNSTCHIILWILLFFSNDMAPIAHTTLYVA